MIRTVTRTTKTLIRTQLPTTNPPCVISYQTLTLTVVNVREAMESSMENNQAMVEVLPVSFRAYNMDLLFFFFGVLLVNNHVVNKRSFMCHKVIQSCMRTTCDSAKIANFVPIFAKNLMLQTNIQKYQQSANGRVFAKIAKNLKLNRVEKIIFNE